MVKLQKKQVKIISVLIALVFIGSVVALALTQSGSGIASAASSNVGVVDYRQIAQQHPQLQSANAEMQKAVQDAQKEFEEKSANMSDADKQALAEKLSKQLAEFEQKKMAPVQKKINKTILDVAKANNIDSVVNMNAMVAGGKDLTDEVIKALK